MSDENRRRSRSERARRAAVAMRQGDPARLRHYRHLLVVGPQRSGTTIGARILARELGFTFVDEREVPGGPDGGMAIIAARPDRCVVQAPAWTFACHRLGGE